VNEFGFVPDYFLTQFVLDKLLIVADSEQFVKFLLLVLNLVFLIGSLHILECIQ